MPIGRPIANTQIYLLDENLTPVPEGEVGELFIGGDGVARGYWNRPDLTGERFLTIPALSDHRIFRTGDLARYGPDGNIEFLGRADYQIKLRGHRIEPGEIEAILESCAGVQQAVIVAREDREGDKRLIAYLIADGIGAEAIATLRNALESKVPEYMIPAAFVFLPELPLTDNAKIDRKALLELEPPSVATTSSAQAGESPANDVERIVANIWQEALGIATIGLHDNFFDAGAHSLTVAEVHARLQQVLERPINLVDLYQFSTVRSLAGYLAGAQKISAAAQPSDRALRRRMARQG
jgi:acyl carrier protein